MYQDLSVTVFDQRKHRYSLRDADKPMADLTLAMSSETAQRIVDAQQAVEAANCAWRDRCAASDAWLEKVNGRLAEIAALLAEYDWPTARQAWGLAMARAAMGEGSQADAKAAEKHDDDCAQLQIRLHAEQQALAELSRRDFGSHAAHSEIRKRERELEDAVHPMPPWPATMESRGRDGRFNIERWQSAARAEWKPAQEVIAHARKVLAEAEGEACTPRSGAG